MRLTAILILLTFMFASGLDARGEDSLSPEEKHIVEIASFTANGDGAALKAAVYDALDSGVAVNEIKEVMVQMYAYCGFPRSLNALNLLMNTVDERKAAGKNDVIGPEASPTDSITDMSAHGEAVRTSLVGRPVTGKVYDFCPVIDQYLRSHLFGDIFSRDNISHRLRELATASALAAMNLESQLRSHLGICRRLGYSEGQLREWADTIARKTGTPNGATAVRVLDGLFPATDSGDDRSQKSTTSSIPQI